MFVVRAMIHLRMAESPNWEAVKIFSRNDRTEPQFRDCKASNKKFKPILKTRNTVVYS